jgi:hypothetical protein
MHERSMTSELQRLGLVKIRRARFGDADDIKVRDAEQTDRFVDALAITCEKGCR